ncbi:MAG: hypothetical protein JNK58_12550 [Phycisphaerae bacterium]|nr:hypothetical protein [Phycisphaerae bacterium]
MRHEVWSMAAILAASGWCAGVHAASIGSGLSTEAISNPAGGERVGAGLATIDVTGIPSMDGLGSPNNVVMFLWVGPFNLVTGIGWDVVLETLVPTSRRRDITMWVRDTLNTPLSGFGIQPGASDPTPGGPTAYSSDGIRKLANNGIPPVRALADGLIRLEFFDSPNNAPNEADGLWVSGTVSLQTISEIPTPVSPGTGAILLLSGTMLVRRKR